MNIFKFKKILSFVIFSLVISMVVQAQEHKDCSDALILCGDSPFNVPLGLGVGDVDSGVDGSCLGDEFNSIWISLEIEASGDLIFDIIPVADNSDFDFLVFQLENGDCDNKSIVRCMASGETGGQDATANEPCIGSTGLAYGETDMTEMPGCTNGSNNYLAPLQVEAGEQYMLMINDFTLGQSAFDLSFGGTAAIECMSTTSTENPFDSNGNWMMTTSSLGGLSVQIIDSFSEGELQIYNITGQMLHKQKVSGNDFLHLGDLNYSGLCIVVLRSDNQFQREQVFVSN